MRAIVLSRRKAWIVALIVLIGAIWLVRNDEAQAGSVPPGEGIDTVFVTTGTNFPDALGVGPVAAINGAPIILVPTNPPLPDVTADELVRLDPERVWVVGGSAVISGPMYLAISDLLPNAVVQRIAGLDRYQTNTFLTSVAFPAVGVASVHASAFTVDGNSGAYTTYNSAHAGDGADYMYAPIQLPHGAEIIAFGVRYVDDDPGLSGVIFGDDLLAHLICQVEPGGFQAFMAEITSTGAPGDTEAEVPMNYPSYSQPSNVRNQACTYYVRVRGTDADSPYIRSAYVIYEES